MTLVVSVVFEHAVFQVSDRRVMWEYPDKRREIRDEPLTKSVVYCDRAVFGFAGYAQVDRKRSDLWIAEQLADVHDLGVGFAKIRDRLTEIFRRPQYRLGHSVVAAGFKREPDSSLTPFYSMITNIFRDGEWLPKPEREFSWLLETAPKDAVGLWACPDWIPAPRLQQLRSVVASAQTLGDAVDAVVIAIREVAAKHDEVGDDLLLSILPRSSVGRAQIMLMSGGPIADTPTFHYLPAKADPVRHGPTFVCGGHVLSNFRAGTLSDEEQEQSRADTREFHRQRRPQRAFLVPVTTVFDQSLGAPKRAPDAGVPLTGATYVYHPTEEIALVLTPDALDGFEELKTLADLQALHREWNGSFGLEHVSEVTGIGWVVP